MSSNLSSKAGGAGAAQPGEEKAPGRPDCGLPDLKGDYKKDGDKCFSRACCDRTRGECFNLEGGRFRLDVRKKGFTVKLSREVVESPSLEIFKTRLDKVLCSLL